MSFLGSLVSAGANLAGSVMGSMSEDKDSKTQREFAQKGVTWKVEDAKRAGVHPLFALGAQTHSFAPVTTGAVQSSMSNMGQDLSRAVAAGTTSQGRMDAQVKALTLTRMGLENDLLASQIAAAKTALPPALPGSPTVLPGQGDTPVLEVNPPQRTPHLVNPRGEKIPTYNLPDAQTYEDRYGEVGSGVYGVRNWLYDNFPGVMELMQKEVQVRGRRPPWRKKGG